jgi:NAD(P)-dependent dehydrogenase (short-subunit alcohol dehydrogenase family)
MPDLKSRIAVVAGASRGAGKGIALALGEAGATVYVVGRTTRDGARPLDGTPGTIDETAAEVTARGGCGIAVRADCTVDADVAAVFARVEREHGRVDVLANAVWGAFDGYTSVEQGMAAWGKMFWEQPTAAWTRMMGAGPQAYFMTSAHAVPLMRRQGRGLIVGVTDFYFGETGGDPSTPGQLLWGLSHQCINLLMRAIAAETKRHKIAVVTLMPGFMRTERVMAAMKTDELKKQFGFEKSESTEYLGRAVAALAADPRAMKKTGTIQFVADLAREYDFRDVDGRQMPRFMP